MIRVVLPEHLRRLARVADEVELRVEGPVTQRSVLDALEAGEVGFVIAGIKELQAAKVGDTITIERKLPNNRGPAAEPLPSLQSLWLAIRVPIAALSVAVFTIAFSVLLLHLVKERRESSAAGPGAGRSFLDTLPPAQTLDRIAYSLHIVAFPLWTFSLIAGAIWADQAWGRYWGWDPVETWAFITWVLYAAFLHARATAGWRGRRAHYIQLLGFASLIFNILVVQVFIAGMHSYSGVS